MDAMKVFFDYNIARAVRLFSFILVFFVKCVQGGI
jgi:hypothetical protein